MQFVCMAFLRESVWQGMSESVRKQFLDEFIDYETDLHRSGHLVAVVPLDDGRNAVTVQRVNGRASVSSGLRDEASPQLRSLLFLEAHDFCHAIQLISHHPCLRAGVVEVRASDERTCRRLEDRGVVTTCRPSPRTAQRGSGQADLKTD